MHQVGHTMKSREQFWDEWPIEPRHPESVYQSDYSKALKISSDELETINTLVFEVIYHSLEPDVQQQVCSARHRDDILRYLDTQERFSIDFAVNADRFVELELVLLEVMNRRALLKHIKGIQFPVDIRVVQAKPPAGYLQRKDAIDYMHCDGWRGEPNDGVNCLLYCQASEHTSRLHILDLPKERMAQVAAFDGDERDCGAVINGLKSIEFEHNPGVMVFFDSYAPHHAFRNGNQTRISLNFTLRRRDAYEVIDERWARERQSWDKYWCLPEHDMHTFQSRCASEIARLQDRGNSNAARLRQLYIDQKLSNNTNEVY